MTKRADKKTQVKRGKNLFMKRHIRIGLKDDFEWLPLTMVVHEGVKVKKISYRSDKIKFSLVITCSEA